MSSARRTDDDLTAKARIRDAAVRRFAEDGMGASLRAVASDAGVSPGLILHHFGSRAGLREACDAYVLEAARTAKSAVLGPGTAGAGAFLAQLSQVEGYAPLVGYLLRCVQAGGPLGGEFIDHFVTDAVAYLEEGVRAGTVRPSRDPQARARVLTAMSLGSLLLHLPARDGRLDLDELPAWLRGYVDTVALPLLELYTEALLTDSTLLDAYVAATGDSRARTSSAVET
ncbi:TetR/AcrR family transcriptional regulator [Georgenia faecalis]|uniref:TetR family transcriptional regulator n=1 Tax=Georgenia faecalis TaxID=2483799 RepID=A0ABV9D8D1_9MICO|nr:TetR family transcriptional regulator [Georgenia faecalis]